MRALAKKMNRFVRMLLGKDLLCIEDITCPKERFGSAYGGWDIVTERITADSVVYSFGVGEDASFDLALIRRFALKVHAFDPTPKSIAWVKSQSFPSDFIMHEYGIADFDGVIAFNPPENDTHVSHTILERPSTKGRAIEVAVKKLSTIMEELGHDKIDIMKMDVEGAEYDVIRDLENTGIRPRQILVEFHHRFPTVGNRKSVDAIKRIRNMGYELFSISASGEEFCFLGKAARSSLPGAQPSSVFTGGCL
jgi:FkbM family methyltransferase